MNRLIPMEWLSGFRLLNRLLWTCLPNLGILSSSSAMCSLCSRTFVHNILINYVEHSRQIWQLENVWRSSYCSFHLQQVIIQFTLHNSFCYRSLLELFHQKHRRKHHLNRCATDALLTSDLCLNKSFAKTAVNRYGFIKKKHSEVEIVRLS